MVHILFVAHGAPGNLIPFEHRIMGLQKGARLAEIRLYDLRVPDDRSQWWLERLGARPSHNSPGNPLGKAQRLGRWIGRILGYSPVHSDVGKLGPRESFNPYVYVAVIGVKPDPLMKGAEIV